MFSEGAYICVRLAWVASISSAKGTLVNITFGLRDVARELSIEVNLTEAELFDAVDKSLASGALLRLTDSRGDTVAISPQAIGYVQVASQQQRRVGFSIS